MISKYSKDDKTGNSLDSNPAYKVDSQEAMHISKRCYCRKQIHILHISITLFELYWGIVLVSY